jgi:hypothetical protein
MHGPQTIDRYYPSKMTGISVDDDDADIMDAPG